MSPEHIYQNMDQYEKAMDDILVGGIFIYFEFVFIFLIILLKAKVMDEVMNKN